MGEQFLCGQVGAIFGTEISRLARSNADVALPMEFAPPLPRDSWGANTVGASDGNPLVTATRRRHPPSMIRYPYSNSSEKVGFLVASYRFQFCAGPSTAPYSRVVPIGGEAALEVTTSSSAADRLAVGQRIASSPAGVFPGLLYPLLPRLVPLSAFDAPSAVDRLGRFAAS